MKKLGVLASAGGAAFAKMEEITRGSDRQFVMITDRPCTAEEKCQSAGMSYHRIEEPDRRHFSKKAADYFKSQGVESCLLFFSRLVSEDLFDTIEAYNIHPSNLPDYTGMFAVKRARENGETQLGATLHRVDAGMDEGEIIAQHIWPADPSWSLQRWQKISYLQKLGLGLIWVEMMLSGAKHSVKLRDQWREAFMQHVEEEGQTATP